MDKNLPADSLGCTATPIAESTCLNAASTTQQVTRLNKGLSPKQQGNNHSNCFSKIGCATQNNSFNNSNSMNAISPNRSRTHASRIDPRVYADVQSSGLVSRIVKYHEKGKNLQRSMSVNNLYSKPGQFPIVHLNRKHLPYKANSQTLSMTRIAPPEKTIFQGNTLSSLLRSSSIVGLHKSSDDLSCENRPILHPPPTENDLAPTRSVLDVLQEISRKRIHSNDLLQNEITKKTCNRSYNDLVDATRTQFGQLNTTQGIKRQREQIAPHQIQQDLHVIPATIANSAHCTQSSPDQSAKRRQNGYNNDITSSLSSSLIHNNKRKLNYDQRHRYGINNSNKTYNGLSYYTSGSSDLSLTNCELQPRAKIHCKQQDLEFKQLRQTMSCTSSITPMPSTQHGQFHQASDAPDPAAPVQRAVSAPVQPVAMLDARSPISASALSADSKKQKLTLFNKDYDCENEGQTTLQSNSEVDPNECDEIQFVKPKKLDSIKNGNNLLIERTQKSKLALMLCGLRGELYNGELPEEDVFDSPATAKMVDKPNKLQSKSDITTAPTTFNFAAGANLSTQTTVANSQPSIISVVTVLPKSTTAITTSPSIATNNASTTSLPPGFSFASPKTTEAVVATASNVVTNSKIASPLVGIKLTPASNQISTAVTNAPTTTTVTVPAPANHNANFGQTNDNLSKPLTFGSNLDKSNSNNPKDTTTIPASAASSGMFSFGTKSTNSSSATSTFSFGTTASAPTQPTANLTFDAKNSLASSTSQPLFGSASTTNSIGSAQANAPNVSATAQVFGSAPTSFISSGAATTTTATTTATVPAIFGASNKQVFNFGNAPTTATTVASTKNTLSFGGPTNCIQTEPASALTTTVNSNFGNVHLATATPTFGNTQASASSGAFGNMPSIKPTAQTAFIAPTQPVKPFSFNGENSDRTASNGTVTSGNANTFSFGNVAAVTTTTTTASTRSNNSVSFTQKPTGQTASFSFGSATNNSPDANTSSAVATGKNNNNSSSHPTSFSFATQNAQKSTSSLFSNGNPTSASLFTFGSGATQKAPPTAAVATATTTTTASSSVFGSNSKTEPNTSSSSNAASPFVFGTQVDKSSTASGGFSFGQTAANVNNTTATTNIFGASATNAPNTGVVKPNFSFGDASSLNTNKPAGAASATFGSFASVTQNKTFTFGSNAQSPAAATNIFRSSAADGVNLTNNNGSAQAVGGFAFVDKSATTAPPTRAGGFSFGTSTGPTHANASKPFGFGGDNSNNTPTAAVAATNIFGGVAKSSATPTNNFNFNATNGAALLPGTPTQNGNAFALRSSSPNDRPIRRATRRLQK